MLLLKKITDKKITKYIEMRTLKTAIGAALAIFIAQLLGLDYGVNTAIVVILSLQNTKRKSLNLAGVRIASSWCKNSFISYCLIHSLGCFFSNWL